MTGYVEGATVFWSRDILKTGNVFWGLHSCFHPEPCIAIFWWFCRDGNNILCQLLKISRLFPSPNLVRACGTVYPHRGAFWSTSGLGTTLSIWKWLPKVWIRTLFGLLAFYLKRVLPRKMCHKCIFLWHTCLFHKDVANRTFSTRVLQTISLVSRLDSRILIRLGALRYATGVLLRRWAWLILSNPVTSSRIRPLTMKHTRVVSTKCTPSYACRAFRDTTLVCFIVNEHTTKCSHYKDIQRTPLFHVLQNGCLYTTCTFV